MRTPIFCLAAVAACSAPPARDPRFVLQGQSAGSCERGESVPLAGGARRVELSLEADPGAAEVTVDGVSRVSAQAGGGCAYVELTPGAHQVVLRGGGADGLGVRFKVSAENPAGPWWYDVFSLGCGRPGLCLRPELVSWRSAVQADRKLITDPCSAMIVRDLKWESERMPRGEEVTGLDLSFTIFVHERPFDHAPRDPACPEN